MNRFSRFQLILIAATVVLLVVDIILAVGYFGALSTKADLENDVDAKEKAIASLQHYSIDALTRDLDEAQQKLAEDSPFPPEIDILEMIEYIIDIVEDTDLSGYSYKHTGGGTTTIEGHKYRTEGYSIIPSRAEKLSRLIKFLRLIEELPYGTAMNDGITLTYAGDDKWTLTFSVRVVTQ
jgi:hypothetical protein